MAQFDIYRLRSTRAAFSLVVDLQADTLHATATRLVAPLVERTAYRAPISRVTPVVDVAHVPHVVVMLQIAAVASTMLVSPTTTIAAYRSELIAAIDLLFTGA